MLRSPAFAGPRCSPGMRGGREMPEIGGSLAAGATLVRLRQWSNERWWAAP